jgi:hypothetical protein
MLLLADYTFYLQQITSSALLSLPGILSLALLIAGIICSRTLSATRTRKYWSGALIVGAMACFWFAMHNTIYEFEEHPETLVFESLPLPAGEPDCGTTWSPWREIGYGLTNSCEFGCYRGLTLRKQMRLRGFPPWPQTRREYQCWKIVKP